MKEREPILPLVMGAVVAVVLHFALVPTVARGLLGSRGDFQSRARFHDGKRVDPPKQDVTDDPTLKPPAPELPEPVVEVGQEDSPIKQSIAWISYDSFEQMRAPRAPTWQPEQQTQVDPVTQAPTPIDPTPPDPNRISQPSPAQAAASQPQPQPQPQLQPDQPPVEVELTTAPTHASPPVPESPQPVEAAQPTGPQPLPEARDQLAMLPPPPDVTPPPEVIQGLSTMTKEPAQDERPHPPGVGSPDTPTPSNPAISEPAQNPTVTPENQTPPPTPTHNETPPSPDIHSQSNPTVSPKTDSESPATTPDRDDKAVKPGKVLARQGLRIQTAVPRFDPVAIWSSIPSNPVVRLTFNNKGDAVNAVVVKSTGYPNIDAPILASLYKWKAQGKKLEQIEGTFDMEITLLLGP